MKREAVAQCYPVQSERKTAFFRETTGRMVLTAQGFKLKFISSVFMGLKNENKKRAVEFFSLPPAYKTRYYKTLFPRYGIFSTIFL